MTGPEAGSVFSFQNTGGSWSRGFYQAIWAEGVQIVAFVPDGRHRGLIGRAQTDARMRAVTLSTEEEQIGELRSDLHTHQGPLLAVKVAHTPDSMTLPPHDGTFLNNRMWAALPGVKAILK